MNIRRRYIFVPLLVVIVVANLYKDESSQIDRLQVPVDTNELPDYYMEQLSIKLFNDDGQLKASINSPTLIHYASQSQAEIQEPEIQLYTVNNLMWNLQAVRGRILDESQDIALEQDVTISLSQENNSPLNFTTNNLFYEFLAHRAWNDSPVTFATAVANGSANGMLINLDTETFELKNRVEVRHQN
ncbi:MAG: LPS export ABC transporter periplasmic protein LptC [Gammaproteobacteria bacterium]